MARRGAPVRLARWALVAFALVVAALTLTADTPLGALRAFTDVANRVADAVSGGRAEVSLREAEALANVVLFVPVGLLLRPAWPAAPLSLLLAVAAGASLAIELAQYAALPGRFPSLIDVLHNAGGAAVGLVVAEDGARAVRAVARRRGRQPFSR